MAGWSLRVVGTGSFCLKSQLPKRIYFSLALGGFAEPGWGRERSAGKDVWGGEGRASLEKEIGGREVLTGPGEVEAGAPSAPLRQRQRWLQPEPRTPAASRRALGARPPHPKRVRERGSLPAAPRPLLHPRGLGCCEPELGFAFRRS